MNVGGYEHRIAWLERLLLHANGEWAEALEQEIAISRQDLEAAKIVAAREVSQS